MDFLYLVPKYFDLTGTSAISRFNYNYYVLNTIEAAKLCILGRFYLIL